MNKAQKSGWGVIIAITSLQVLQTYARAEPVRFEFTGIVNRATGGYSSIPLGSNVMGTLTIDFDKSIDPDCYTPPVTAPWICVLTGGSFSDKPPIPIAERMLEFVVSVNEFSYRTSDYPPSDYAENHQVEANIEVRDKRYNRWNSRTRATYEPAPTDDTHGAELTFLNPDELPYTDTGYPVLSGITIGEGRFSARTDGPGTNGVVFYDITSLTALDPVPVNTPPPNDGGGNGGGGGGGGAMGIWGGLALLGIVFRRARPFRNRARCMISR